MLRKAQIVHTEHGDSEQGRGRRRELTAQGGLEVISQISATPPRECAECEGGKRSGELADGPRRDWRGSGVGTNRARGVCHVSGKSPA